MGLRPEDLQRLGIQVDQPETERPNDPKRSAAGALARMRGEAFEAQLCEQHAAYRRDGLADVEKIPTPALVMGRTKKDRRGRTCFPACWAQRTSVDFGGVLAGGRAVRIEAKYRAEMLTGRDIADHQRDALRRCHDLSGLALLLVRVWPQTWVVPAEVLWLPGVKTWRPARLDEIGARVAGCDWLRALGSTGGRDSSAARL